jgi:hypothetical protein
MSDNKGLFNTLTVIAGIIFAVQGVFSHNIYLKIFNCLGLIFLLFALHYELCAIYANKYIKLVSPTLFIVIVILFFIDPISLIDKSESQKQIEALQDTLSIRNDSIKTLKYLLAFESNSRTYSTQKLELAEKYFNANSAPAIRILGIDPIIEIGKKMQINIFIENSGGMATSIITHTNCCFHTVPYNTFSLIKSQSLVLNNFAPKEQKTLILPFAKELTKEFYDDIYANKIYVYGYGILDYVDKFNNRYKKEFCIVFDKDSKSFEDVQNYKLTYE